METDSNGRNKGNKTGVESCHAEIWKKPAKQGHE